MEGTIRELEILQAQRGNLWKAVRDRHLTTGEAKQFLKRELSLLHAVLQFEQYLDFHDYDAHQHNHPEERGVAHPLRADLVRLRNHEIKVKKTLANPALFEAYVQEMLAPPGKKLR